jgi:general stress protein 26
MCSVVPLGRVHAQQDPVAGTQRDSLIAAAREIMAASRFGALITLDESGHPRVRTMDPFPPDEDMVVWFGTNRRTRKVQEIENDPRVTLYYAAPEADGYVSVYGTARLVDDPDEKARRWKPEWERFYPDRESTYLLIAVTPERMEIVSYTRGIFGDPDTWKPASVEFPESNPEANPPD